MGGKRTSRFFAGPDRACEELQQRLRDSVAQQRAGREEANDPCTVSAFDCRTA